MAAHAHTDAGAWTIEHGTLVGAERLTLMRKRGTCFVPTINDGRVALDRSALPLQ